MRKFFFQEGGGVPQVFDVGQGFARPLQVNLAPVIGVASQPLDVGRDTYAQMNQLLLNEEHLELQKDQAERQKQLDRINNLKYISELADKTSTWGALPGADTEQLNQIIGELNSPEALRAASQSIDGMATHIAKYAEATGKARPLVRRRIAWEQGRKEHAEAMTQYLNLVDKGAAQIVNPEFGAIMDKWGNNLEAFAAGDPNVNESGITAAGMGIQDMISPERLKEYATQANETAKANAELTKSRAQEALYTAKTKEAALNSEFANAAQRVGITPRGSLGEYTSEEQSKIYNRIGQDQYEKQEIANNLARVQASVASGKMTLENIPYLVAINNALPDHSQISKIEDIGRLGEILEKLSPVEREDFYRAYQASNIVAGKDKTSTDWNAFKDFLASQGKSPSDYTEQELVELYARFKGRSSDVSHAGGSQSNSVIKDKDGSVSKIKINGQWVENGTTKDTRLPEGISFIEKGGKMYLRVAFGEKKRAKYLGDLFGIDITDPWFSDWDVDDFAVDLKDKIPAGSFNEGSYLYIPADEVSQQTTNNTQGTTSSSQGSRISGAPRVIAPKKGDPSVIPD